MLSLKKPFDSSAVSLSQHALFPSMPQHHFSHRFNGQVISDAKLANIIYCYNKATLYVIHGFYLGTMPRTVTKPTVRFVPI